MKLKLARIQRYKRFAERSSLDTRGRIIAVVGPNEAGKTSLLDAIKHLSPGTQEYDRKEFTDRQAPDDQTKSAARSSGKRSLAPSISTTSFVPGTWSRSH
jgi:AAA15 family ATPase/GTPase